MSFSISALTNGAVKIVNDDTNEIKYFSNSLHTAEISETNLVIVNLEVNMPAFTADYSAVSSPSSSDIEDLCDQLNASPYFFNGSSGGGGGGNITPGSIDFSVPRWNTVGNEWEENTNFVTEWSSAFQNFMVRSSFTLFGLGGFFAHSESLAGDDQLAVSMFPGSMAFNSYDDFTSGSAIQLKFNTDKSLEIRWAEGLAGGINNTVQAMRVQECHTADVVTDDVASNCGFIINSQNATYMQDTVNSAIIAGDKIVCEFDNTLATGNVQITKGIFLANQVLASVDTLMTEECSVYIATAALTFTFPVTIFKDGQVIYIKNASGGNVTVDPGLHTIDGSSTPIVLATTTSMTLINISNTDNFIIV